MENGRFAFSSPFSRGLGATYYGKLIVDFLLVLVALFSLGVTAEALRANICWKLAFRSNGVIIIIIIIILFVQ